MASLTPKKLSFQGVPGAYSHQACREVFPEAEAIACPTFESTIEAVKSGQADLAMLPVENSTYGRVADIHRLLPESGLHIVAEHFLRVQIAMLALPGTHMDQVKTARSHTVLLGQCSRFLGQHNILPVVGADTAGSAKQVAEQDDASEAALASELAGEIYGLDVLARGIEDRDDNTTRFLIMSPDLEFTKPVENRVLTTFVFRVRNIPAALYKAMGGFATNGVNMVKLESYMVDGSFTATQFYADVIGHPDEPALARALEELAYFTDYLEILGVYPVADFRVASASL
ncbi:MAG: prephenate dehydratase [Pseudomonadota bacterium]